MRNKQGSFVKRLFRWRFFFVVNLFVILLLSLTLGREIYRSHDIQAEIDALQAQADDLAARNIAMSELGTAMQTRSFIEREARLKLGLKKPGEEVVIIKNDNKTVGEDEIADASDPLNLVIDPDVPVDDVANSKKWWYYFFDKQAYRALHDYES